MPDEKLNRLMQLLEGESEPMLSVTGSSMLALASLIELEVRAGQLIMPMAGPEDDSMILHETLINAGALRFLDIRMHDGEMVKFYEVTEVGHLMLTAFKSGVYASANQDELGLDDPDDSGDDVVGVMQ